MVGRLNCLLGLALAPSSPSHCHLVRQRAEMNVMAKTMAEHSLPILVVEDDPSLREAIGDTLELAGRPYVAVGGGAEALKAVPYTHLDVYKRQCSRCTRIVAIICGCSFLIRSATVGASIHFKPSIPCLLYTSRCV